MCSEAGSEGGSEGCAKVGIINIRLYRTNFVRFYGAEIFKKQNVVSDEGDCN